MFISLAIESNSEFVSGKNARYADFAPFPRVAWAGARMQLFTVARHGRIRISIFSLFVCANIITALAVKDAWYFR